MLASASGGIIVQTCQGLLSFIDTSCVVHGASHELYLSTDSCINSKSVISGFPCGFDLRKMQSGLHALEVPQPELQPLLTSLRRLKTWCYIFNDMDILVHFGAPNVSKPILPHPSSLPSNQLFVKIPLA